MEKIGPRIYKGIYFIRLDDLPQEQADSIMQWLPVSEIFKIKTDHEVITQCIQYKHYEEWVELHLKENKQLIR